MRTNIHFTPVYGVDDGAALCCLLEVDGFRILLECGWDDTFGLEQIESLRDVAPTVDVVLVSYPDIAHIGALPYARANFGLKAPVYGTIPVYKFSQVCLYDAYQAQRYQSNFELFRPEQIDECMCGFVQLKHSQRVPLGGKGEGIDLMPHCAGHMIGGSIWLITKNVERILYAVDYNIRTEKHLNPCILTSLSELNKEKAMRHLDRSLLASLLRPTVMITDALMPSQPQQRSSERNRRMASLIFSTLREGGDVLIPVDSAGRVLELLIWIEECWADKQRYQVVFLSNTAYSVVEFAKTQLEWLQDILSQKFYDERINAFDLKNVVTAHSLEDLESLSKPRVILASTSSLMHGYAVDLFINMAPNKSNAIILTERGSPATLANRLYSMVSSGCPLAEEIEVPRWKRVPLVGKEMDAYCAKKKLEEEEKAARRKKHLDAVRNDAAKDNKDFDADADDSSTLSNFWKGFDLHQDGLQKIRARGQHPVFPFVEPRTAFDDYGEIVYLEAPVQSLLHVQQQAFSGLDESDESDEDLSTKPVFEIAKVKLASKIHFFDFEGRTDRRSVKRILGQVVPRKLVLIHGTNESKQDIADYAKSELSKQIAHVYIPAHLQRIDLSSKIPFLNATIKHQNFSHLHFVQSADYSLSLFSGVLTPPASKALPYELKYEDGSKNKDENDGTFIGDVQLKNFKADLDLLGLQTELKGGILKINGVVTVMKEPTGIEGYSRLKLDGQMCDSYFQVRDLLYNKLTVL
ncbi:cleavage and polyadenylation specificity factor subunit 2-like [Schistocerca gregaria]|uniref:cleavage and polyadenylation specificity factor subunit 2-like n=1 Tax=Schistocerca gregaria TaxID=7010 RepID=UPI00211EAF79|nr:cleavage and polyadenylation specificity factor subunit 2-like [Schistocerca gregaria]